MWDVPVATPTDLDDAVSAAKTAFTTWSALPHDGRSKFVKEFASRLEQHKAEFTQLLYRETGKPVRSKTGQWHNAEELYQPMQPTKSNLPNPI